MQTFINIILCISIIAVFLEGWIVFRNLKSSLHAYLLLSCIATVVNNIGYFLEIHTHSEEAFLAALKLSYLGRGLMAFLLFLFTAELCRIRLSQHVKNVLMLVHAAFYVIILTLEKHELYYVNYHFQTDGLFPVIKHENGIAYGLFMFLQTMYIAIALFWLLRAISKEKSIGRKRRLWVVTSAYIVESTYFIIQITGFGKVSDQLDISVVGNVVLTFCMYIAIFRYDLLGVTEIAKDFMIDRLSEGVIAVDREGIVQYFNEPAKSLYPALEDEPASVVDEIKHAIAIGKTIKIDDRIYTPEENELKEQEHSFGMLYALVDSTALKLKEYKLKSDAVMLQMAAKSMRERLLTTEELMRQDRAMRHDRRHFEALLLSLITDGKTEEVKKCLEERMAQEPHTAARYCDNTTVNAALTHYVSEAQNKDIDVKIKANIPSELGVDEMMLAIVISNLLENAIHACEKLDKEERRIEITAKYKEQLLLEIVNSCEGRVPLDDLGRPYATEEGHGIGTRSVLAFVDQTDSDIRYIAEEGVFKVRMMIG